MPLHPFSHDLALLTLSLHSMHFISFITVCTGFWTVLSHDQCMFPACLRPSLIALSMRINILMIADHLNHFSNFYEFFTHLLVYFHLCGHHHAWHTPHIICHHTMSQTHPFWCPNWGATLASMLVRSCFSFILPSSSSFSSLLSYPCHDHIWFFDF